MSRPASDPARGRSPREIGAIGVLGGSFDPVHNAHLAIAHAGLIELELERILWIPSGKPPHRAAPLACAADRVAMLELALDGEPRFVIDTRELQKASPGYTVETLGELRSERGPDAPLVLLIGADQFAKLASWYRWKDLFTLAHIAVFARPGWGAGELGDAALRAEFATRCDTTVGAWRALPAGRIVPVAATPLDISSTAIRARISAGEQPLALLPAAVLDYIASKHLYSRTEHPTT